ncbi:unnamed protein product [Polarella glacialis]|uniref:Uncharacterized protein n=1 Tax=Polarella glacialis TaxID=89957 RepID=A0A813HWP2_POLGL|nr:unnamed protein product [Polarella glacialis]
MLRGPEGIALKPMVNVTGDGVGREVYFSDYLNQRIRKVVKTSAGWMIYTVAGTGTMGENPLCDTGCDALTEATLWNPRALAFSSTQDLYFVDSGARKIRKLTPGSPGIISTFAGRASTYSNVDMSSSFGDMVSRMLTGSFMQSNDQVQMRALYFLNIDHNDNVWFVDSTNARILMSPLSNLSHVSTTADFGSYQKKFFRNLFQGARTLQERTALAPLVAQGGRRQMAMAGVSTADEVTIDMCTSKRISEARPGQGSTVRMIELAVMSIATTADRRPQALVTNIILRFSLLSLCPSRNRATREMTDARMSLCWDSLGCGMSKKTEQRSMSQGAHQAQMMLLLTAQIAVEGWNEASRTLTKIAEGARSLRVIHLSLGCLWDRVEDPVRQEGQPPRRSGRAAGRHDDREGRHGEADVPQDTQAHLRDQDRDRRRRDDRDAVQHDDHGRHPTDHRGQQRDDSRGLRQQDVAHHDDLSRRTPDDHQKDHGHQREGDRGHRQQASRDVAAEDQQGRNQTEEGQEDRGSQRPREKRPQQKNDRDPGRRDARPDDRREARGEQQDRGHRQEEAELPPPSDPVRHRQEGRPQDRSYQRAEDPRLQQKGADEDYRREDHSRSRHEDPRLQQKGADEDYRREDHSRSRHHEDPHARDRRDGREELRPKTVYGQPSEDRSRLRREPEDRGQRGQADRAPREAAGKAQREGDQGGQREPVARRATESEPSKVPDSQAAAERGGRGRGGDDARARRLEPSHPQPTGEGKSRAGEGKRRPVDRKRREEVNVKAPVSETLPEPADEGYADVPEGPPLTSDPYYVSLEADPEEPAVAPSQGVWEDGDAGPPQESGDRDGRGRNRGEEPRGESRRWESRGRDRDTQEDRAGARLRLRESDRQGDGKAADGRDPGRADGGLNRPRRGRQAEGSSDAAQPGGGSRQVHLKGPKRKPLTLTPRTA